MGKTNSYFPPSNLERFDVLDFDFDFGVGGDVGDALDEDVGAALVKEAGELALAAGGVIDGAGFFLALDFAFDDTVADAQGHVVDGAAAGEGEGVDGLHWVGCGVAEDLPDLDADDGALDVGADGGVFERAGSVELPVRIDSREHAAGGATGGDCLWLPKTQGGEAEGYN